ERDDEQHDRDAKRVAIEQPIGESYEDREHQKRARRDGLVRPRLGHCKGSISHELATSLSGRSGVTLPRPPKRRSRRRNAAIAAARSAAVKSGHIRSVNHSSAYALSHSRKSESRCSPPERIRRSTSEAPASSAAACAM